MQSSTYDMNNYRSIGNKRASTTTFALAKFLATTGPDEYPGHHNKLHTYDLYPSVDHPHPFKSLPSSKTNIFERLRKKTSLANTKYMQRHTTGDYSNSAVVFQGAPFGKNSLLHRKHIPLAHDSNQPNFYPNHTSSSSSPPPPPPPPERPQAPPFYETKEDNVGDTLPSFPTPPASSVHESVEETPSPLVVPSKKKNIIRGSRHIQVQTQVVPKDRCERCCRPFQPPTRRDSCPAVLGTGAKLVQKKNLMGHEATVLLALIEQLKQQLAEEQQSRKVLEKAIQLQWAAEQN